MRKKVKSFYDPPSLILKQFGSSIFMAYLNGWKKFPSWIINHAFKSIQVANGAWGMGCIGYPGHPAWEVTGSCNLKCVHCHASSENSSENELNTNEAKKLIEEIASIKEFRTLVYTGGEPLVRNDIFELLNYSKSLGIANIIATNGTLIDEKMAFKLKESGVVCIAISLDDTDPSTHDKIRNKKGAFELAIRAIEATKKANILLQINTTAMLYNFNHIAELIDFANKNKAGIMLVYQLITVGRGEFIGNATLNKEENRKLIELILEKQKDTTTIIEPVAAPQYWAYLLKKNNIEDGYLLKISEKLFYGCSAGRGFVYIKSNGDVWPCPFVKISAGNVKEKSFVEIYRNSEIFRKLRNRENLLEGNCGKCNYKSICGGCRGRAYASTGNYLGEDPNCFIYSL